MLSKEQYQQFPKLFKKNYKYDKLIKLKELSLLQTSEITNELFELLCQLDLEELHLSNCIITNLSHISNIKTLKRLFVHNMNVNDYSFLLHIPLLEELTLSKCIIKDLSILSSLKNLTLLDLYETNIVDIKFLSKLINIQRLNLFHTNIKDLSPLKKLKNIKWLELSKTKVDDRAIVVISGLGDINYLGISDLVFTDISELSKLKQLKELDLYRTIITKGSLGGLDILKKKKGLSINM